jgi:hypothetical protein
MSKRPFSITTYTGTANRSVNMPTAAIQHQPGHRNQGNDALRPGGGNGSHDKGGHGVPVGTRVVLAGVTGPVFARKLSRFSG